MTGDEMDGWRAFQERVADLFRTIPGCQVSVGEVLSGSRIGRIEVDVVARFGGPPESPHGFVFTIIIECKLWKQRIPQEKVFALKTIVEDVGASLGILVSETGMQSGAREYADTPVNVKALSFSELQAYAQGKSHDVQCSICGRQGVIPFRLYVGKPIYCEDCFRELRIRRQRGRSG